MKRAAVYFAELVERNQHLSTRDRMHDADLLCHRATDEFQQQRLKIACNLKSPFAKHRTLLRNHSGVCATLWCLR